MSDTAWVWLVGVVLGTVATAPMLLRLRKREQETELAEARARSYGLHEPSSLHPIVDPERCIGTGSCIDACPEQVLGLRAGQAVAVAPASCIGHGLCERSCPMEAIRLVFGTKTRGVDIPRVREDFETNVPGLYVIGELGGMGLIRNAFEQGLQCIEGISRKPDRSGGKDLLDLVIVGAGPAGLAASLYAQAAGLRFVTLEREPDAGGTVRHYPRKKLVMSSPVRVPGHGKIGAKEILKEELIDLWRRLWVDLPIHTGCTVKVVHKAGNGFAIETSGYGYHARRVVLAIGRRGVPRKLGVPGEELGNVQYALAEAEQFRGDSVLVVGGGDSAVEAALALSEEPGTTVRVSYRRESFSRIKPANRARLDAAMGRGAIEVHWTTVPARIERDRVWLAPAEAEGGGVDGVPDGTYAIDNDQVLVFAGGELPTAFLRSCGVAIDTKFGTA